MARPDSRDFYICFYVIYFLHINIYPRSAIVNNSGIIALKKQGKALLFLL